MGVAPKISCFNICFFSREEFVVFWDLRPVETCESEIDFDVVESHFDDGDESFLDGSQIAHLVLVAQQVEQGVEKLEPKGTQKRKEN